MATTQLHANANASRSDTLSGTAVPIPYRKFSSSITYSVDISRLILTDHDPTINMSSIRQQDTLFTSFLESRMPDVLEPKLKAALSTFGLDLAQNPLLVPAVMSAVSFYHRAMWTAFQEQIPSLQNLGAAGPIQHESDAIELYDVGHASAPQSFRSEFNEQQAGGMNTTTKSTNCWSYIATTPPSQALLPPTPNSTGSMTLFPTTNYMPPNHPLTSWNSDSGRGTLPLCGHGMCDSMCDDCFHRKSMDLMKSPMAPPAFLFNQNFPQASPESNKQGQPSSWIARYYDLHSLGRNQLPIGTEASML
jgi:hypothetical protein